MIGAVTEADVVDVIANQTPEARHRGTDDVHIEPAVDKIRDGLALVLGTSTSALTVTSRPSRTRRCRSTSESTTCATLPRRSG